MREDNLSLRHGLTVGTRLTQDRTPAMVTCASCGAQSSDERFVCEACGARLVSSEPLPEPAKQAGISELRAAVERLAADRRAEIDDARASAGLPPVLRSLSPPPPAPGRSAAGVHLVSLNSDGSDGVAYPLGAGPVDIGRTAGDLLFDDPFLASRHARVATTAEGHLLMPLERRNGVYRRLRGPADLSPGDRILVGRQLLLFEVTPPSERAPLPAVENGQVVFGSRTRPAWARLLQLTTAGVARDVFHLGVGEIVIGRERTDLVFADDDLISARHAKLSLRSGRVLLEDLSSLNGTFLALRAPHVLAPGDVVRMGNQVFRFERR
jgi:pSer/pThr/pTyr-binding forkhead associated (FHA) protein